MTKTVFTTMVSELDYVNVTCSHCSGKLEVPLKGSYPEQCPFCKEPYLEGDKTALRRLKEAIMIAKEAKYLVFSFKTESDN